MAKGTNNPGLTKGAYNAASADLDVADAAQLAAIEARALETWATTSAAFESEVKRCAEQTGIELWEARKWVRTFNCVDSFAAEVARLMGKEHNDATAQWAKDESLSTLSDITRIATNGPEAQLAGMYTSLLRARENIKNCELMDAIAAIASTGEFLPSLLEMIAEDKRGEVARRAANMRHDRPGGSHDKQEKIRAIWASGKFTSRDRCAEEECAGLDMSFSAARRALRNTPDPA